jgi:CRP/FNR family transcriptional regulator, dissimilatory nitrate respiration regulator
MTDPTPAFDELRRAHLFAQADDAQLAALTRAMHAVRLDAGDTLFTHGQPAERFYFVRSGQIKLFRLSPEGQEKIIEIIQPGQTFAEAVMFMGNKGRYPVNAQAVTGAELYAFEQKAFLKMLADSTEISFGMLASMSRRLHMLVNQIESLTLQNATYRLVVYLLEQIPKDVVQSPEVQLTTPKGVIAARLAIQPETFSRILAKLKKHALIEVHSNHILLKDLKGLRELVFLPAARDDDDPIGHC